MNEPSPRKSDAQAADGITVADVEARVASGMMEANERVELIHGELVGMAGKSARHEAVKGALLALWYPACPAGFMLAPEITFRLAEDTFVKTDIVVYREDTGLAGLTGGNVELVVEISDESLDYDLGRKARLYASFGVREFWVIDAEKRRVAVFRDPAAEGYRTNLEHDGDVPIAPAFAPPEFALALGQLQINELRLSEASVRSYAFPAEDAISGRIG